MAMQAAKRANVSINQSTRVFSDEFNGSYFNRMSRCQRHLSLAFL